MRGATCKHLRHTHFRQRTLLDVNPAGGHRTDWHQYSFSVYVPAYFFQLLASITALGSANFPLSVIATPTHSLEFYDLETHECAPPSRCSTVASAVLTRQAFKTSSHTLNYPTRSAAPGQGPEASLATNR